jgi:hypothetical protein
VKALARVTLLACLLSLSISAKFIVNDHIISPRAVVVLEKISSELTEKTDIYAYVIATKDKLPRGTNLYEYSKEFEGNLSKPYVIFIFAPNSKRLGLIPSSSEIKSYYDGDEVKRYAVDIVKSDDSNSLQSKYDVAIVQAYSELADELASHKGVELSSSLNDPYDWIIDVVRWIVWLGAILIFWVYFGRPIYMRIKNGKK